MRRLGPLSVLAIVLAGCVGPTGVDDAPPCANAAPLLGESSGLPRYLVVFRDGSDAGAVTRRLAEQYGFTPRYVWESALLGFAADLSPAALDGVRCAREVRYVEHDQVMRAI